MTTTPAEPDAPELQATRCTQAAGRQAAGRQVAGRRRRAVGHREYPRSRRGSRAGERRTARAAQVGTAAVDRVVDLLAAGAGTTELAAAIDRAAQAARPLVGWPTYEAMTQLLDTTRRCGRHRTGSHTVQACADLADACRFLRGALEFDGFLPAPAPPGAEEAAVPRFLVSLTAEDDGETSPTPPLTPQQRRHAAGDDPRYPQLRDPPS